MSFRGRLTLFFMLMVIVPMAVVTLVVFHLINDSEHDRREARIAALQQPAVLLGQAMRDDAERAVVRVAGDVRLVAAVRAGARSGADTRARELAESLGLPRLVIHGADGATLVDIGQGDPLFQARRSLRDESVVIATVEVTVVTADAYAELVKRASLQDVVVRQGARRLSSTLSGVPQRLPEDGGEVRIGDHDYRVASFSGSGAGGPATSVFVLVNVDPRSGTFTRQRLIAVVILLGVFVLVLGFAIAASRSLQRQIGGFLVAARRLGRGELDTKVPTAGNDEFAALGHEFNTMAGQLQDRLGQLRRERDRVGRSMLRLGDAVASNLDRDGLLGIVVETAVEGVGAAGGRAILRQAPGGPFGERVHVGQLDGFEELLGEVEAQVLSSGAPADLHRGELSALAHPLRGSDSHEVLGVLSVARHGQLFAAADHELFSYLAGQAAVSIANVGLHEAVRRQATIDALTGLNTRRRFDEALSAEIERARRFPDQGLGLVLLDIDDFKAVNDSYGHQVGDEVLRQVARVLRETSRESDAPSRYGGEELAVVLPGTDLQGAFEMAERVRVGIEAIAIAVDGGVSLRVTASFGAAALPSDGGSGSELVRAADAALYEAKRAGKNRTVRAE